MSRRPLLTAKQVRTIGPIERDAEQRWQLVLSAASAIHAGNGDTAHILLAWNLLLMAAGNFKRQAPITPHDIPVPWPVADVSMSADCVRLPNGQPLRRDDPISWAALTSIKGVGVATATTVLAALWPNDHAIVDTRAMSSAVGLAVHQRGWGTPAIPSGHPTKLMPITWNDYSWYLDEVTLAAEVGDMTPTAVERALYVLDDKVVTVKGRSWADYGEALMDYLRRKGGEPS